MIIRDAVICDQPRVLGRKHRDPALGDGHALDVLPLAKELRKPVASESADAVAATTDPSLSPSAPMREPGLSFESVAAWLAVQDRQIRAACAAVLADELTHVHESARAEGHAAGLAQGFAEGSERAQREIEKQWAIVRKMAEAAESAFLTEQHRVSDLCVDTVAEAITKVAGPLLATRDAASGAVAEVLKRVKEGRELTIRVSPSELSILQQEEARLAAALPGRKFVLVADVRVDIGGCIVESKLGSLDGRLEVQLRELYETLRRAKLAPAEHP